MTSPALPSPDAATAGRERDASRLSRGITATWWYTFGGIVFFELMVVFFWVVAVLSADRSFAAACAVGVAGLIWVAATVPLLRDHHTRMDADSAAGWRRAAVPGAVVIACAVVIGVASGMWIMAVAAVCQALVLLGWGPGVRRRIVLGVTVVLAALWFIDARLTFPADIGSNGWLVGFFSTFLPAMTVVTLWWWDVLVSLNRARLSESRLGATQERLRVATDVHDLQGHHLQVIALQLELAERLMADDPDAALAQLQAARVSVDEARQGTRDLATRFRSVSLSDELANAVDLLRAAGTTADAVVDAGVADAPASVLGPVIREATTNILRHGGGTWARLSLERVGPAWRLEVANDAADDPPGAASGGGAGLAGIARRVEEAGGGHEVRPGKGTFTLVVTLPAQPEAVP